MSIDARHSAAALAARRQALVALCAQQRVDAAYEIKALVRPLAPGGLGRYLGAASLKLPLTIAGVVLGLALTRPGRAMSMIGAGLSLWKMARQVLPMLARPGAKSSTP